MRVKDNAYQLILLIWPRPSTSTSALGVLKFTIMVDRSSVIITIYFILSEPCSGVKKKIYREIHFFTLKWSPLGVRGHGIYYFLSPYPTYATYKIWLRLAQYSSWYDNARRTLDDRRQLIGIGHLSDLDDLKKQK